jgi:hypothetical protein
MVTAVAVVDSNPDAPADVACHEYRAICGHYYRVIYVNVMELIRAHSNLGDDKVKAFQKRPKVRKQSDN